MKSQLEKLIDKWEVEQGSYLPNAKMFKLFIDDAKQSLQLEKEEQKLHVDLVSKRCTDFATWVQKNHYHKKEGGHPNNIGKWYSDYVDTGYLTDEEIHREFLLNFC